MTFISVIHVPFITVVLKASGGYSLANKGMKKILGLGY